MQAIIGMFTAVAGVIGVIGSLISLKFWWITMVVMTIVKLVGAGSYVWFAGPFTMGAISTGLWMLFGGLIMLGISFMIATIGDALIKG